MSQPIRNRGGNDRFRIALKEHFLMASREIFLASLLTSHLNSRFEEEVENSSANERP